MKEDILKGIIESSGGEHICVRCCTPYTTLRKALLCAYYCWQKEAEYHGEKLGKHSVLAAKAQFETTSCREKSFIALRYLPREKKK